MLNGGVFSSEGLEVTAIFFFTLFGIFYFFSSEIRFLKRPTALRFVE